MENMDKYLVGGFNPSEKYEFVSWDYDIPNKWKKCSKPPTRYDLWQLSNTKAPGSFAKSSSTRIRATSRICAYEQL